ncbi:MAG TPA: hypothetical protein VHC18_05740 [Amycolatopsis sp.]|nr:hypothetical protein [Amycolatopsis sp.]
MRTTTAELTALSEAVHDGITTITYLRKRVTPHAIKSRCRPGGPWRRLLPGVVMLNEGEPTRPQQLRAAVYYAGAGAVVSGIDALRAHGVRLPTAKRVHVLVPPHRRVLSQDFVRLERTSRVPEPIFQHGIPFAPPARATIDVARDAADPDMLRRLLAMPVYYGLCTTADLRHELEAGNQRGTAAVREMLRNLGTMGTTYLQGVARELLDSVPLPAPMWNVTVCDVHDHPIGVVDAWWDEVALAWQFGGTPDQSPTRNHLALTAAGVTLVRTPPEDLRAQAHRVARELTSAFAAAAKRRRPRVQALGTVPATV